MSEVAEDMAKPVSLPYGAEYAKSSRSMCKGCKQPIAKDSLRMSVRFQSPFFDGMQDNWHHFECFWKKARKNDINEASIKGLEWIRWEDQEAIRQRITDLQEMRDDCNFRKSHIPKVDRAKTSNGKCAKCKEKLRKGELRVSFKAAFHHAACFAALGVVTKPANTISGYELLEDAEKLTFDLLFSATDQPDDEEANLEAGSSKRKAAADDDAENNNTTGENLKDEPSSAKRPKTVFGESRTIRKKMKEQAKIIWDAMEAIHRNLTKEEIEEILLDNGVFKFKHDSLELRVELLADILVFGMPAPCVECPNGVLRFSNSVKSYKCTGSISEFTRCSYMNKNPSRERVKIAKSLAKEHPFLRDYRKPSLPERTYSEAAEQAGVIAEPAIVKKFAPRSNREHESGGVARVVVKNGCTVDPDCDMAAMTHVYIDSATKRPYQVTLGATDVQSGKNSYYKLQLLKHDAKEKFYLFRSWGRIGTTSGGSKTDSYGNDLTAAKAIFEEMFKDKTRREWTDGLENFKKHPFGMNVLEMEMDSGGGQETNTPTKLDISTSTSKLAEPIKRLLAMIFDVDSMNKTMREFDINLDKMPLGKLSRKHIHSAYQILTDIQRILQGGGDAHTLKIQCVDASNRFYTLIPHSCGMKVPAILDNLNLIKKKTDMLDNLLEMQIAYSIIKSEEEIRDGRDLFDVHYDKLNCAIEVLDRDSKEFKLIQKYMRNTHAATHSTYRLEIIDVLKVDRNQDRERFKADIGNRQLLWHGSRVTNFVGILSQGLRIAPPEAPHAGYMFGKGIYTADMASKSANYCGVLDGTGRVLPNHDEGLLVLCDVALGNMYELNCAQYIERLPKGKNSVKSLGDTAPDPKNIEWLDGMKIPCGKSKKIRSDAALLYNEYVVYDETQVRIRYLVRTKFVSTLDF